MRSFTHILFAITGSSILLGTASPGILLYAALGSQLPDCDTSTSYPGRVNIHSQGGLLRTFNLWMGIPSGAVELVNEDQDRFLLVADIDGINTLSQQRVEGTYQVIRALSSSDLLLEQEGKLYRAGGGIDAQIRLSRIFVQRGRRVRSEIQQIGFTDQTFTLPPDEGSPIQVTYTGILQVEDAFDLSISPSVEEYQPVSLQFLGDERALIRFTSARREDLLPFEGVYGSGQMLIRRVYGD